MGPLLWKLGVLATGPPEKFLHLSFHMMANTKMVHLLQVLHQLFPSAAFLIII